MPSATLLVAGRPHVAVGEPWGCGAFMDPPRFLAPGDVLETEVEGLGVLRNPVKAV